MSLDPKSYLEALAMSLQASPDATATLHRVKDFYQKQLWHEFSTQLLELIQHEPAMKVAAADIHDILLTPTRSNLDGAVYVKLVYHACFGIMAEAVPGDTSASDKVNSLLDSAIASLMTNGHNQCVTAVHCLKALVFMTHGPSLEAKTLLDKASDTIASIPVHEINPVLQALYYRAHVRQCELLYDYDAFYASTFAFLRYGTLAGLPLVADELGAVAYKTAIAALLAKKVYNFGELLTTEPFVNALKGSSDASNTWALDVVQQCSNGDVAGYEHFVRSRGDVISAIPELADAVRSGRLGSKVRLMALLHRIYHTPADKRVLPFSAIAEQCSIQPNQVEPLLLTAMAQHLIEGTVDELEQTVEVTWVLPRVMELKEIEALAADIAKWRQAVKDTAAKVGDLAKHISK